MLIYRRQIKVITYREWETFLSTRGKILLVDALILMICFVGISRLITKAALPVKAVKENSDVLLYFSDQIIPQMNDSEITSVNSITVYTTDQIEFITDGMNIGDSIPVILNKGSTSSVIQLELIPFYTATYIILVIITGLFCFTLGLFTLIKSQNKEVAIVFHWLCICTTGIIMNTWGNYTEPSLFLGVLSNIIFILSYSFLPPLFLLFTFLFPVRGIQRIINIIPVLFILSVILAASDIYLFTKALSLKTIISIQSYLLNEQAIRIFFIVVLVVGIIKIFSSLKQANIDSEKKKLKWVLYGIIIGPLFYILAWLLPQLIFSKIIIPEEFVLIFISFIPLTFTVSILKYRILDIDLVIKRSIVYSASLGVVIGLYLFIIWSISLLITNSDTEVPALVSVSIVALFFQPAQKRIQTIVDRKFFNANYVFRIALRKFFNEVGQCKNKREAAEKILEKINKIIPVMNCCVYSIKKCDLNIEKLASLTTDCNDDLFMKNSQSLISQDDLTNPLCLAESCEPEADINLDKAGLMENSCYKIIFPLFSSDRNLLGLLALSEKKSGFKYTIEDIDLLAQIVSRLGIIFEKFNLNEELIEGHLKEVKLEELNKIKSFFISSVSHELKTPLTSIKMFSEILKTSPEITVEKRNEYLNIIEEECNRLNRFIEDVLDLSKIERNIKNYSLKKINLNDLVSYVSDLIQYQIKLAKCKLIVNYSIAEIDITADFDAIVSVMINLITNAIKYSSLIKKIEVSIFLKDNQPAVSVRDWGIGISAEDISEIQEPYFRSKSVLAKSIPGSGIGLALVKNILDYHNFKLEIISDKNIGSCFTIIFK